MHGSISQNLPCFYFPADFAATFPAHFESFLCDDAECQALRKSILQLRGNPSDYVFAMAMIVLQRGRIGEVRRYGDGSIYVSFDVDIMGRTNRRETNLRFRMRVDEEYNLKAYTIVFDEPVEDVAWAVRCGTILMRDLKDPEEVFSCIEKVPCGMASKVWYSRVSSRSLDILPMNFEGCRTYDLRFMYDNPPFCFCVRGMSGAEMRKVVDAYLHGGYSALATAADWEYWNCLEDSYLSNVGINMRLLLHMTYAEFMRQDGVVRLLSALDVRDEPMPTFWMPRHGTDWISVVENLYAIARGPLEMRRDSEGRLLSEKACDRVVAYAALNGHERAKTDMLEKFNCQVEPIPSFGVAYKCCEPE